MPCPYANALGVPGEGFHSQRIGDFALNDIVGTFALAGMTSVIFKVDLTKSIIAWFVGGEIAHYVFGVDTPVLRAIGMSPVCDDKAKDESVL